MTRKPKPGRITLEKLFPVCKYTAAVLISVSYPFFPDSITFLPGIIVPRACLMGWVAVLILLSLAADHCVEKAKEKDRLELEQKKPYGGMNRSTFLALSVPVLFLLNIAAVVHMYYAYMNSELSGVAGAQLFTFSAANAVMAVGIVLVIYGCVMKRICYNNIWGIRSKAALAGPEAWLRIHTRAALPTLLFGVLSLAAGTFLPDVAAIAVAAVCCCAAFILMFTMKGSSK